MNPTQGSVVRANTRNEKRSGEHLEEIEKDKVQERLTGH
jgi:hypothetical protein